MRLIAFTFYLLLSMQLTELFGALELEHQEKTGTAFHRELARKINARLETDPESMKTCLERLRHLVLSDRVGFFFNVNAERDGGRVVLRGQTERLEFKHITREVFRHLGFSEVSDCVEIVPDVAADPDPFGVTVAAHALTWSDPGLAGAPMDEALLGEPVYVLQTLTQSVLIKTLTGYWGYTARENIRRVGREEFIQLLNAPKAVLLEDCEVAGRRLPVGARLVIEAWVQGGECVLRGPSGEALRVPQACCRRTARGQGIEEVLAYARGMVGAPYQLGGKNRTSGIDCSGLVQLAYRGVGLNLPRDAKQQYLGGHLILPCVAEALLPGDALFFMNAAGQVDHVALYLGERKIVHATGDAVKVAGMDRGAGDYCERFDGDFIGAKRFWW